MGVSLQQYRVTIGTHAGSLWKKTPATRSRARSKSRSTTRKSGRCRKHGPGLLLAAVKGMVTIGVILGLIILTTTQLGLEEDRVTCDTIGVPSGQWLTDVQPVVSLYDSRRSLILSNDVETNPGPHSDQFEKSLCDGQAV